jgi:hypothetical protein
MNGQGVIGQDCVWCGAPAVCEIEVQAAQYRSATRVDPISGERTSDRRLARAAIHAPACTEHKQVTRGQPPPVAVPCERRAAGDVDQLGLFVHADTARLRNAISGEVHR